MWKRAWSAMKQRVAGLKALPAKVKNLPALLQQSPKQIEASLAQLTALDYLYYTMMLVLVGFSLYLAIGVQPLRAMGIEVVVTLLLFHGEVWRVLPSERRRVKNEALLLVRVMERTAEGPQREAENVM